MLILIFQETSNFLDLISYPLGSTIFVMLLSLTIALFSSFLTKKLVDTEELERKQKLIKKHKTEKKEIIKLAETNPKQYRKKKVKWKRKEQFIKNIEQGMTLQRFKPMCFTFLPMMIMFGILSLFFERNPIACTPMNANDIFLIGEYIWAATNIDKLPPAWTALVWGEARHIGQFEGWIGFTAWYFLNSLCCNTIINRLLGIQSQTTGGMEGMFKGMGAEAQEFPDI